MAKSRRRYPPLASMGPTPRTSSRIATCRPNCGGAIRRWMRSEEHTSELQSLMRISYAVFCLKKKNTKNKKHITDHLRQTINIHPHSNINILTHEQLHHY